MRMMSFMVIFALGSLVTNIYVYGSCRYDGTPWQPEWSQEIRDDLLCSASACPEPSPGFVIESEKRHKCCTCRSCMTWEDSEQDLFIEYASVLGRSLVIPNQAPNNSDVYKVEYRYSEMTEIPSNICNWDNETNLAELYGDYFHNMSEFWENLVELDFTGNKIRRIPDINCLLRLDKLYLDNNNIENLSNTSFTNLTRLRVFSLNGNRLKNLDPSIFTSPQMNLFYADLSNNDIQKLDVSNTMSLYPFCKIDYSNNEIDEIVNDNDFKLEMDKTYGPGFVDLKDVKIKVLPNFKELFQLDSWEQMGKLISFGFDYRGIPLICDCNLEPFLSLAESIIKVIWRDYHNVTCTGPEHNAGKPVIDVPTEEFICPIKQDKGCQSPECTCVDRPKEDTLYIDCSYQNLDKLPTIPVSNHSKYVSLNVSGNYITQIANMSYLSKLISLDISRNDLHGISDSTAKQLENCTNIDISDNPKIGSLPQTFQYRNICTTYMRNLNIECNCDTSWIETWLSSKECRMNNLFQCDIQNIGIQPAMDFHVSNLNCFFSPFLFILGSILAAVALILIIASVILYWYRYEILIIFLRMRRKKKNAVLPHIYDVMVSFNENERHVTNWVIKSLEPHLRESGYSVFVTLKDIGYGSERNDEVITAINSSRNFLLILSESYLQLADEGMRSWTENEWKFGWNMFRHDRSKNIVLVNFDHMIPSKVDHPVIKAYLRVGCTVDFENHERTIMEEIETKLGKPVRLDDIDMKVNDNSNTKFPKANLFIGTLYQDEDSHDDIDLNGDEEDMRNDSDTQENMAENQTTKNKLNYTHKLCKYRKCYACQQKEITLFRKINPVFQEIVDR